MADDSTILSLLAAKFPGQVTPLELNPKQLAVQIEPQIVTSLFEYLLTDPALKFNLLSSISGVDAIYNIDLVYFISSLEFKHKLMVRTKVDRSGGKIETISNILPAANWFEREIWELYGVDFAGHPNLTRFLLPEDWNEGNPMLRDWTGKDFVKMPEVAG